MGMSMFMNSPYNNPRNRRANNNSNPFGIDRSDHLAGHFQNARQSAAEQMSDQQQQRMESRPYPQQQTGMNARPYPRQSTMGNNQSNSNDANNVDVNNAQASTQSQKPNQSASSMNTTSDKGLGQNTTINIDLTKMSRNDLRNAILLNEILSAPVSKRKNRSRFGRRGA